MKVRHLKVDGLLSLQNVDVELPDRGIVLVTGANGAGKSSLVESVAVACWGKTMRGTPPWAGNKALVVVDTDKLTITRKRSGSRSDLQVDGLDEFDTSTKAQDRLTSAIGTFEAWRRTCAFSSQDAAHFSMASGGDRQRLFESMLGHERFDKASERVRKDANAADLKVARVDTKVEAQRSKVELLRRKLNEAADLLDVQKSSEDPAALTAQIDRVSAEISQFDALIDGVSDRMQEEARKHGGITAELREAEQRKRSLDRSACPTCGQPIPEDLRHRLSIAVSDLRNKLEDFVRAQGDDLPGARDGYRESQRRLQQMVTELRTRKTQAETEIRERSSLAKGAAAAEMEHEEEAAILVDLLDEQEEDHAEAVELRVVADVLGLRGVRAHMLGSVLASVEQVANTWLQRIAGEDLRLTLTPYTEKQGGVIDSIALNVEGAGGGHGYKAASGGQRRRIDVALLLAFAEFASGIYGNTDSTLWFDEVFDALDGDGIDAVSQVLEEVSRTRAVVVISHNVNLTRKLHPAMRLVVDDGNVRQDSAP